MSQAITHILNKTCGTCQFWEGERRAIFSSTDTSQGAVHFDGAIKAECTGEFNPELFLAGHSCDSHKKWDCVEKRRN